MPVVEIAAVSFGRFGVGRLDGKAVLIPATAPGDLIEAQIVGEHRDYLEGMPIKLMRASALRRAAPCPYLPHCGGCDWQHIGYGAQARLKAEMIAREFSRVLKISLDEAALVEAAPLEFGYRRRLRLQVGRGGEVGFYRPGTREIVEVDSCLVAAPGIEPGLARAAALAFARECREVELAADPARLVVTLWLGRAAGPHEVERARRLLEGHGRLTGVILRAGQQRTVVGEPSLTVELEPGLAVEVDADCFSQVNHAQNRRAVALVMDLAGAGPEAALLDLYCGAGNFALPAARRGAEVVGVDADRWAVACAERGRARLRLAGARFLAMGAETAIQFLRRAGYRPSAIILDPPRAGARGVIDEIAKLRAERVIYVSCNLPVLLRDLQRLTARRYRVENVRGFDFFPNTHHVEVVAQVVLT